MIFWVHLDFHYLKKKKKEEKVGYCSQTNLLLWGSLLLFQEGPSSVSREFKWNVYTSLLLICQPNLQGPRHWTRPTEHNTRKAGGMTGNEWRWKESWRSSGWEWEWPRSLCHEGLSQVWPQKQKSGRSTSDSLTLLSHSHSLELNDSLTYPSERIENCL